MDASAYETPMSDELVEEFPEPEPEIVIEPVKIVPSKEAKIALPTAISENLASAKALKTCKKFVGKWIELKVGKTILDTKDVIAHLRAHGLVE